MPLFRRNKRENRSSPPGSGAGAIPPPPTATDEIREAIDLSIVNLSSPDLRGETPIKFVGSDPACKRMLRGTSALPMTASIDDEMREYTNHAFAKSETISAPLNFQVRWKWFVEDLFGKDEPHKPTSIDVGSLRQYAESFNITLDANGVKNVQAEATMKLYAMTSMTIPNSTPQLRQEYAATFSDGPGASPERFETDYAQLVDWIWPRHAGFRHDARRGLRDALLNQGRSQGQFPPIPDFSFQEMVNSYIS